MFKFLHAQNGTFKPVTMAVKSWFGHLDFAIGAANNQLTVQRGVFAVQVSLRGTPEFRRPAWTTTAYKLEGGAGLGSVQINHAVFLHLISEEFINEHSRLLVFEFNAGMSARTWWNEAQWGAAFVSETEKGNHDKSRFLFHKLTFGSMTDRWLHSVRAAEVGGVTRDVTLTSPFVRSSIFATLLQNASVYQDNAGYMPTLHVHTFYGQDARPDQRWQHFRGQAATLPGAVSGFAMIAQGGFKSILMGDELASWTMPAAAGWTVERIASRLARTLAKYPAFARNLERVSDCENSSTIIPHASNLPIEVLHLSGLASPNPVL